jgi:hypothetical protein
MNMKSAHPLQEEELMAYLDGELRPDLASIAAAHLERCSECRATAAGMRELSQRLATWEIEMAKPDIPAAIDSAVETHVRARKKRLAAHHRSCRQILGTRRLVWAGGALAVLLVLFAAGLFNYRSHNGIQNAEVYDAYQPRTRAAIPSQEGRGAGGGYSTNGTIGRLKSQENLKPTADGAGEGDDAPAKAEKENGALSPAPSGPMIVRTAELALTTKEFDKARAGAEDILKRHGGYVGELSVNAPANAGRTLTATFRVPSDQLDAAMAELKRLGRVETESQRGEEVTQQYVDLQARLANARHTEQRLSDLLRDRTGKLSDVLAFEKEIDRVRGEIESMEAQRKSLAKQVNYATLNTTVTEDYSQQLQVVPPSTSTRFRNAAVDGYRSLADGFVSLLLFLLSAGPSLLVWGGILLLVVRVAWKRLRRKIA